MQKLTRLYNWTTYLAITRWLVGGYEETPHHS